jgi:putative Mg2+ transporter-C (MgtC) family protein
MSILGTLAPLGLAFVLCSVVGLERELRQKSAGLRTHTLVGLASAAIMLVSKHGFSDVLLPGREVLDPSRVAAQIVSGIGFIGGGLIFVRRDAVRGLTTAAGIWLVAGVGMACGAGLPLLACALTAGHLLVSYGYTPLTRRLPRSQPDAWMVRLSLENGRGVLRRALEVATRRHFVVTDVSIERPADNTGVATVTVEVEGGAGIADLVAAIGELDGVVEVATEGLEDSA